MYFVDRSKIEANLTFIEDKLNFYEKFNVENTVENHLILERISHVLIESIIDVGNSMIDGFIMRDPGSYEDIIDILLDESVISNGDAKLLKEFINERKMLVQDYIQINHERLHHKFNQTVPAMKNFPFQIRKYLDEELGPVSAFKS